MSKAKSSQSSEWIDEPIKAQQGPQSFMLSCPVKSIIYGGARGGGKSFGLLLDFASQANRYGKHCRGLLLRRRYKDLEDLVDKSKKIFNSLGWRFTEKPPTWKSPEGAILRMRAVDKDQDAEKFKGFEITWLGIDEIGDFPNPVPLDKLWGSVRSAHGVPTVRRASANPGGSGHAWVYARYIRDRKPYEVFEEVPLPSDRPDLRIQTVFIPSRIEDNPALLKNDPTYEASLAMSGNAKQFKAWRWGDWSSLAGQFFDIFNPAVHVKNSRLIRLEPWFQRWISMDWGFDDYTAVHWHAMDEDRKVYTYRELYVRQKNSIEVGELIVQANGDDQISQFYAPSDILEKRGATNTIAEQIAAITRPAGIPYPSPADRSAGSRVAGWQLMYQMLASGNWIISDSCPILVESLPLLVRDANNMEDIAESSVDHAPDSARYGLKSHLGHVRIPTDELLLRQIAGIADPQVKYMKHIKAIADEHKKYGQLMTRRSRYRISKEAWE